MNIRELIDSYVMEGYEELYASAKVAQDLILYYLSKSNYKNNITLKGGVVMFNLTHNRRRATIDIDFDLAKTLLSNKKLVEIFSENCISDYAIIIDEKKISDLKHQDYKGKRVPLNIKDGYGNNLYIVVDIGVQNNLDILQNILTFNTSINKESLQFFANPKEQIFVEKVIPLIKFGALSTRYKDLFDIYWLINSGLNKIEILKYLKLLLFDCSPKIKNIEDIINVFDLVFSSAQFTKPLENKKYNWIDINIDSLKKVIYKFLEEIREINLF